MPEVLSQKQIDELLGSLQSGNVDIKEIEESSSSKKIKEYDFRTPKKFTRERIKLLDSIFENFSRLLSLHFSSILRTTCQMEILQIEEQQYYEFNNALSDSVLMGIIDLGKESNSEDNHQILMEMSRSVSFSILDKMLGGNGSGYKVERDYTDIEISFFQYLFKQIATVLQNAWSNYIDVETKLSMIETNSRLIQSISPEETIVIVVISVELKYITGNINICLPKNALDVIFKSFESKYAKSPRKGDPHQNDLRKEIILDTLKDSDLTVTGLLGETEITLSDLLGLKVGDIIPLNSSFSKDSIKVNIENIPWFYGKMGISKKKYAVRVGKKV